MIYTYSKSVSSEEDFDNHTLEFDPEKFIPQSSVVCVYSLLLGLRQPKQVFSEGMVHTIRPMFVPFPKNGINFIKIEEDASRKANPPQKSTKDPKTKSKASPAKSKTASTIQFSCTIAPLNQGNSYFITLEAEGALSKESQLTIGADKQKLDISNQSSTARHLLELLGKLQVARGFSVGQAEQFKKNVRNIKVRAIDNETETLHFILEVSGSEANKILGLKSEPFKYQEKFFHNMDKNLLEFFTTKKQLALRRDFTKDQLELLRTINVSAGTKFRLKEAEKDMTWKQIQHKYEWIEKFFQEVLDSGVYFDYILVSFITNKTKKFQMQMPKVKHLVEIMKENESNIFSEDQTGIEEKIRPYLNQAKLGLASILGLVVETVFIKQLIKNWEIVKLNDQSLPHLLECSVIEANIHKAIWMIINRFEAWRMVRKLVITRLVRLHMSQSEKNKGSKTKKQNGKGPNKTDESMKDDENEEEGVMEEEDEVEEDSLSKKVKIEA